MDADGTEGPRPAAGAVIEEKFSPRKHHMAYYAAVLFHHKVEFGNEIGIFAVLIEHIMLMAARAIHVPKCFAGEVFHLAIVGWLF